jgi:streptomycin 6-kinase
MVPVSAVLARNTRDLWGGRGERWLAALPAFVADVARAWELEVGPPFDLTFNWVAPVVRRDGTAAVLKLGMPDSRHIRTEAAALSVYDGVGAVRLLAADPSRGALLTERARPGTPASQLVPRRDHEATAAIINVVRRLHRSPPSGTALPELTAERASFTHYLRSYPGDGPLPRRVVERAARLFEELCETATGRVVLHGDLHHDNVLRADRERWLAIDPRGVIGDPGYDLGALLYNPDPGRRDRQLLALVPARIEHLAETLGLPVQRLTAWGFVKAVLSEVWSVAGGMPPRGRQLDVALHLLPRLTD